MMHSEMYKREYTGEFVSRWDDLIGWDGRRAGENGFFERLLRRHGCNRVADVATGTGYHAITLAGDGFEVVAADGSAAMIDRTKRNAERRGVELAELAVVDWRELDQRFGDAAFDAILCLGNAFTHLFDHGDRIAALRSMHRTLKPGGILVLDHRNYDRMLEQGYSSKHRHYYTGSGVKVRPVELTTERVRLEYAYPDQKSFHLTMFPLRSDYARSLLGEAGFDEIISYGDFELSFDPDKVDFIQQVAVKRA